MKFYRPLTPIKAISFDLDDTLYANAPVMVSAEDKMVHYFSRNFSVCLTDKNKGLILDQKFWSPFKAQAIAKQASIIHDVVALRLESYFLGACSLGFDKKQAQDKAQQAMDHFSIVRSQFTVPQASHQLLAKLAHHYPLVAISNGNVDTKAIGIDHYFEHVFHAIAGVKQKPDTEMFQMACSKLAIKPSQLLHVGDCGRADILGGIAAGCQTAWLPLYNIGKPLTILPHMVLSNITELADLLTNKN
ncbi:MAG: HAD-IA family hydrolase [Colwellia sp.]|nr:HAD-IA family hydrolase [Colwellia sp.]